MPVWLLVVALAGGGTYVGCSTPPLVDSNTNWLRMCSESAECGSALACVCGICTETCSLDSTCGERGGVCAEPEGLNGNACSSTAEGGGPQSSGTAICLPGCSADEDCDSDWACVQGACVEPPTDGLAPLTWPTPELESPQILNLDGAPELMLLDPGGDYILQAEAPLSGRLSIQGGRNIIISGIEIAVAEFEADPRHLLSLQGIDGTVHIEGVSLRGVNAATGIFIDAPDAVVQLQNVRVEGITASSGEASALEPAVLRAERAVEIRVDGLSGSTQHHGLVFAPPAIDDLGAIRLQRVDLRSESEDGTLFHMETADAYTLIDCYAQLSPSRPGGLGSALWPDEDVPAPAGCVIEQDSNGREIASWPDIVVPPLDGSVIAGRPEAGTFVPAGLIGLKYEAPGYK